MEEIKKINNTVGTEDKVIDITLPETTKKLRIDGKVFYFNTDSLDLLREIESIGEKVRDIDLSDIPEQEKLMEILKESKDGIDLALGSGTFVALFGDNMDSYLRPLYLLSQLVSICREVTGEVIDIKYSSERAKGRE
ncbi:MAG: hypothetical protein J5982_03310 [Bacilli bacterium]|nr:hypothetical protein [Bacilli bacterium]